MPQDLGKADHGRHRVIHIADREDLLVVAAADAAKPGLDENPIIAGQANVGDIAVRSAAKGPVYAVGEMYPSSFEAMIRGAFRS